MSLPGTVSKNLASAHHQIEEAGATERPNVKQYRSHLVE